MRIVTVVGARPQFVKCAPLSRELRKGHQEILVHTGQHYDFEMSGVFFDQLGIPAPDHNLGIGSMAPGRQTGEMLGKIEDILAAERPDLVIVFGDTNSTLAGALAASKAGVRLAHVEAGLRSFDRAMPEEVNRVLTDHLSDLLFCPTQNAVDNLRGEGITKGVHLVGDVMVDALEPFLRSPRGSGNVVSKLGLEEDGFVLATVHRASNTDDEVNLRNIVEGLGDSPRPVLFPVHPRTRKALSQSGLWGELPGNIRAVDPVGYLEMLELISGAHMVVTDSGGVQKEAYLLSTPCVTLRDTSEWMETVDAGWNVLVGPDRARIGEALRRFTPRGEHKGLYGDGDASRKIVDVLEGRDPGRLAG